MKEQLAAVRRRDLMSDADLQAQSTDLLRSIATAARNGNVTDLSGGDWADVRERLTDISTSRAKQGFSPEETARLCLLVEAASFYKIKG